MSDWRSAAAVVRGRAGTETPTLGIVLGSGLGGLVDDLQDAVSIPYTDLPGFPVSGVSGHEGRLLIGTLRGTRAVLFAGRAHYYEHGDATAMQTPIRMLSELGCEILMLSNAAGSTARTMGPGSLMAISDHITWSGRNPLIGLQDDSRFVDLSAAYDLQLRERLHFVAEAQGTFLHRGIYAWFSGPTFETPAEIRAINMLGADAVGMSTVPECILARHAGLRVAAVSVITNYAAGMQAEPLSHEQTKRESGKAAEQFKSLIAGFAEGLAHC